MNDRDEIKELFSDKLRNMEADVNPQLWANISSQISTAGASGGFISSLSLPAKIIGTIAAGAIITTSVVLFSGKTEDENILSDLSATDEIITSKPLSEETILSKEKLALEAESNQSDPITTSVPEESNDNVNITPIRNDDVVVLDIVEKTDRVIDRDYLVEEDKLNGDDIIVEESDKDDVVKPDPVIDIKTEDNTETPNENFMDVSNETVLTVPNVFTPNGDYVNDEFFITSNNTLQEFSVVIFDIKGNVVYQSEDPDFKWNGIDMYGNICEPGKYLCMITAKDANGKSVLNSGYFNIKMY